jgi:hypothetical protein
MKAFAVAIVLFVGASQLHAEEIQFWLNRFGGIFIETAKGKERVRVFQGNKETEDTIFESRLIPSAPGTYATPKGTVFTLKHLEKPIINDRNRRINSGDWQLTVSGKGKEFDRLKPKMPFVAFGALPPFVYLGEKAE